MCLKNNLRDSLPPRVATPMTAYAFDHTLNIILNLYSRFMSVSARLGEMVGVGRWAQASGLEILIR